VSGLFIELYLDEDVDVVVAELLRARGFVVVTTQEARQVGSADEQQLAFAASHSKTILTHNRVDFEVLARQYINRGQTHYGVIIASRRKPNEIARRLLIILNQVTADEMKDQVRYI
jgi:hypothetical protein